MFLCFLVVWLLSLLITNRWYRYGWHVERFPWKGQLLRNHVDTRQPFHFLFYCDVCFPDVCVCVWDDTGCTPRLVQNRQVTDVLP